MTDINKRKRKLLNAIAKNNGACLFELALESGIPYATAWRYINHLEDEGEIKINRSGPGNPLEIKPQGVHNG